MRVRSTALAGLLLLTSCVLPLRARVIDIPADYATIQEGIDNASGGDTVMVWPGTYHEHDIDFLGKSITVMGTDPGDSTVVASTIVNADSLGRGFVFQSFEDTTSVLTGLKIVGGFLYAEFGGGVYCDSSSPVISNNIISGNTTGFDGGGISCLYSSAVISNNTITGNTTSLKGGGIYCLYSSPTISDNVITGNSARDGGGISCEYSSPEITGNRITGNSSSDHGGGIHCQYESSPTITGNVISNNVANKDGGGIDCDFDSSPLISGNTISGNSAGYDVYWGGGGIRCSNSSSPTITSNVIADNTSANHGGGIYCRDSASEISFNTITGNVAGGDGGGIRCRTCSSLITGNVITGNYTTGAAGTGGGIDYQYSSNTSLVNNIIAGNSAYRGGGVSLNESSPTLVNNTIVQNTASDGGGGMWCAEFSNPLATNTIFWENQAPEGPEIWIAYLDTMTIRYCDVRGGVDSVHAEGEIEWGEGMIESDPLILGPSQADYHLSPESPCVDAGTDEGVYDDYEGDSRPVGYGFDIGADETPYSVAYNLTLTPTGPLSVPRGDDLQFRSLIQNNTDFPVSGDFWLSVRLPNSSEVLVPPALLNLPNPQSGEVPGNSRYAPNAVLSVPPLVDTGTYTLIGRIGAYPATIIDEDSFDFQVTP